MTAARSIKALKERVLWSVAGFINDPPDSDYQLGFLDSLLVVAREYLGEDMDRWPYASAKNVSLIYRDKAHAGRTIRQSPGRPAESQRRTRKR